MSVKCVNCDGDMTSLEGGCNHGVYVGYYCQHCLDTVPQLSDLKTRRPTKAQESSLKDNEAPVHKEKHTPGPWACDRYPGNHRMWRITAPYLSRRATICLTSNWIDSDPEEEMDANARLIAAAPELLEALGEMVNEAQPLGIERPAYKAALAAITRAEGR